MPIYIIFTFSIQLYNQLFNKQIQYMKSAYDASFSRQNTNNVSAVQSDPKRKMVSFLQNSIQVQTQKRQLAEKHLYEYRLRSIKIQNEFSRLLQKYDNQVAIINGRLSESQDIWNKLINEIQNFNQNSQQMLEKRCNQILFMMNRRIINIMQKTEYEIKKNKKLSQEEFHSIREQIKESLSLAKQIQNQNIGLKNMNKQLSFKVSILKQQRDLLVQELTQKKLMIIKLGRFYQNDVKTCLESPRSFSIKAKTTKQSHTPKFICSPSIKDMSSVFMQNPQTVRRRSSVSKGKPQTQSIILKTDRHLKICIERQKRKNAQLKGIVAKLHFKCNQIGSLIDKTLKQVPKNSLGVQKAAILSELVNSVKIKLVIAQGNSKIGLSQKQLSELLNL